MGDGVHGGRIEHERLGVRVPTVTRRHRRGGGRVRRRGGRAGRAGLRNFLRRKNPYISYQSNILFFFISRLDDKDDRVENETSQPPSFHVASFFFYFAFYSFALSPSLSLSIFFSFLLRSGSD